MVIVYVLQGTKRRYVGITNNLERRLREHASSSHSGKLIGPHHPLYTEKTESHAEARVREKFFKSGQGRDYLKQKFPDT